MSDLRARVELLRRLRSTGPVLLITLVSLTVLASLVPAATAVALAALVGGVRTSSTVAAAPLAGYLLTLLAGHVVATVLDPVRFLAEARINADHRAEVARLAAGTEPIDVLERADVQALIRQSRADPESFFEGTPGLGAMAQLDRIGQVLTLLSSGAVLAAYSWWLVVLVVVAAVAIQRVDSWEASEWRRMWRGTVASSLRADVWADALVSPGEGKDLRVFGLGDWAVARIQDHVRAGFGPMWTVGRGVLAVQWLPFVLVLVPLGLAYAAVASDASAGVAAAVFAAGAGVFRSLSGTARGETSALACVTAFGALRRELSRRSDGGDAPPDTGAPPLVRFEGVSFTYPGTGRPVLDRLDLSIRPGELLGVVGLNGAGKSTLIKLLAMLYEPTGGRITADGVDLAGVDPARWRQRLSIVFQDFVRYHLSAADNVALGNAAVPRDEPALVAAAREAGLDPVLDRLPAGWDTPLARTRTGGVDLSGGQWQQVVLARALYAVRTGAAILVLDEPTAHLDVRTEFDVFGRLAAQKGDATVVLISHRLSTVRRSDRIVLIDGGRIAEAGSHDELMALGGRYAEMFTIQADRFNRGFDDRIEEGDLP